MTEELSPGGRALALVLISLMAACNWLLPCLISMKHPLSLGVFLCWSLITGCGHALVLMVLWAKWHQP